MGNHESIITVTYSCFWSWKSSETLLSLRYKIETLQLYHFIKIEVMISEWDSHFHSMKLDFDGDGIDGLILTFEENG